MTEQATAEIRGFQTEARKLLKLMINSLYSNREIFLRELISNASDAIDRLRFESLTDESLIADDPDFRIAIEFDNDAGTVSVVDNGIGMSRDEAVENLGTIAKSGTEEFFDALTGDEKKDSALIGQFGVGFYSSFIVASDVEVLTRRAGEDVGTRWTSTGEDDFTVEDAADVARGTRVTLTLKADAKEFAESYRLRSVVRKYSDHVGVPVMMAKEGGDDDNKEPELEAVNSAKALWTRPRNDVGDDEYKEFYKHVSHDFDDPVAWSHNKVEGKLEYTSLLYIPKRAPFDLWNREMPRGLKLYVQRVFIMDEADQFLPLYLRFVRGVVDSSDLPLNVSREILQQDDRTRTIRNALTKRVLDMLAKMDPAEYHEVWDEFGLVLKEGVGEDFANKDELLGLLRFASTHDSDPTQRTSLKDYIARMNDDSEEAESEEEPEGEAKAEAGAEGDASVDDASADESDGKRRDKIYYLIADSDAAARSSPHLEAFRARGIEVLLLSDRIDEWWMSFVEEFDGLKFQDVARGELDLDDAADESKEDTAKSDDEPLLKRIGEVLGDKVEGVRESKRLTDSPACLVLGEHDMGIQMRRIMEATGQAAPESKPHFEVNLTHPLVERLNDEADEDRFGDLIAILFDQASLAEGNAVTEPGAYVKRVNKLLVELLG
ncbi:MAG: molecular chaperone HtpG [Pseudomonadales bacterium]|nr:molecular chaperone HtpG [Pseudomonadales bacterium]